MDWTLYPELGAITKDAMEPAEDELSVRPFQCGSCIRVGNHLGRSVQANHSANNIPLELQSQERSSKTRQNPLLSTPILLYSSWLWKELLSEKCLGGA